MLGSTTAVLLKIYQNRFGHAPHVTHFFTLCMAASIAVVMLCFARFGLHLRFAAAWLAAAMGVLYALNMPVYQKALTVGGIGMCSVFLFLGALLLPFLYGVLFLSEKLTVWRIFGLVAVVGAVATQIDLRSKAAKKFFLYGVAIFCMNGLFCVLLKVQSGLGSNTFEVMCVAGAVAAAVAAVLFAVTKRRARKAERTAEEEEQTAAAKHTKADAGIAAITTAGYGVLNGFSNVLQMTVANMLPAVVQFPVFSAGTIVATVLWGAAVFREKLTVRNALAVALSVAAIVLCAI